MPNVRSSHIQRVSHEGTTLKVTFQNGKTYHYEGVPETLYKSLMGAQSKGAFLYRWIIGGPKPRKGKLVE
jgi:hypothetical protein